VKKWLRPHIRWKADSGNVNICTCRTLRTVGVPCKQAASTATVNKGGGRWLGRRSVCPVTKDRKRDWKCWQCTEWVCKDYCVKTKCDNCQQQSQCWQCTEWVCKDYCVKTKCDNCQQQSQCWYFIHTSVLNCTFLSANISCISFNEKWKSWTKLIFCIQMSLGIKLTKKNVEKIIK